MPRPEQEAAPLPSRRELRAARRAVSAQAPLPSRRELREVRRAASAAVAREESVAPRRARRAVGQPVVSPQSVVADELTVFSAQARPADPATPSGAQAPRVVVEQAAATIEPAARDDELAVIDASPATPEAAVILTATTEAPATPDATVTIPETAETPASTEITEPVPALSATIFTRTATSPSEETPTERIAAVPHVSRRATHSAHAVSRVRMQARASMAVATSVVVGFGAASVIAGAGQSAAAVTGSPVVSSLEQAPVIDATVPAAFAKNTEAADIDRVLGARALAESAPAKPAVCADESANGLTAALTDTSNSVVAMPVREGSYRISSGYGNRWNPIAGGYQFHLGSDFAAELGTPIYAVADGTVEYVGIGKDGRSNNLVIIRHENGGDVFWSWYVHMYDNGIHVAEGEQVEVGQHIADVGNNGRSTGPHLHLEIHTDQSGTTVDPLGFLADRGARDVSNLCS